ncbi:hypothetical protein [Oceanibaculum nanhaiense]|jgi:hypothetical protein|uniref:hypothetical protein n=1 Tax=Oceanibaculum nanhaiense TaxID=1909734 RepID=UPI000A3B098B|nr:hypothetical protein [Oceanibaculum nanhaiense]|tara:strand:- start:108 stop:494 length:387 start_codon:yes stop_codon:yes gene_type:complete
MSVKETNVFVHRPLAGFERYIPSLGLARKLEAGGDIALLFGGADIDKATCGLLAASEDEEWVQVLHAYPEDVQALAVFLVNLGIRPDELGVMRDWDGRQLFDVDSLAATITALAAGAEAPGLKSGMEF